MKKTLLILSLFLAFTTNAQTRIKVMSYNLLDFPTQFPNDRFPYLTAILDNVQPDIFMVCELADAATADLILNNALRTQDDHYSRAVFTANTSSSYTDLQQLVFYDNHKLLLTAQTLIKTYIRDINHFTFKLKTENSASNPIYLDVFVAHLKSSTGAPYEGNRLDMVNSFTATLSSIPANHFVLIGGDFNLYTSSEPAYQKLLNATNAIVLVDPINRPGNWNSNSSFQDIHTQSTRGSSFTDGLGNYYGAGGYLDDRFDFILMSKNLQTSTDLHYVTNTYKAFGNNGNCYNKAINDASCSGTFSQTIRNNLYNMSDHLPVVMELETPENTLAVSLQSIAESVIFIRGNVVTDWLELKTPDNLKGQTLNIFNQLGQVVLKTTISSLNLTQLNVSNLKSGIYYIKIENINQIKPLKFIKLH